MTPQTAGGPPVYLFTIDSLRADFFSETYFPNCWDNFVDDFTRFSNAYANGIATPLAFPSILADDHVRDNGVLSITASTLAERLPEPSIAIPNNVHLAEERGYHRGFSRFDVEIDLPGAISRFLSIDCFRRNALGHVRQRLPVFGDPPVPVPYRPAERMVYEIKKAVRETPPSFLWAHFMDPHGPYHPNLVFDRDLSISFEDFDDVHDRWKNDAELDDVSIDKLVGVYEEKIRYLDRYLIALLQWLMREDRYDDAILILTGDHGQLIGEGGRFGHDWDNLPVDELLRVPLLIKYPDGSSPGEVFTHLVQHLDIHSTVAELVPTDVGVNPESVPMRDASDRFVIAKSNSAIRGISGGGEVLMGGDGSIETTGDPSHALIDRVEAAEPANVTADVGQGSMTEKERLRVNERLERLGYM